MEINHIYNQDCIQGMDKMIEEGMKVDLIISDPPYSISKSSNFHTMKDRKNPRTGTYFGEWDEDFDNAMWIDRASQLLRAGGGMIVFCHIKRATPIIDCAQESGLVYKDTLVWRKTNPMPRNRERRYVSDIDILIWLVKSGKWTFNRQLDPYESRVFSCASESGGGFKRYHPTQKPIKLLDHIIKIHSNENDLILDPFMGSGSTAITAMRNKRNFIGFEIDKQYYDVAMARIDKKIKEAKTE